MTLFFDGLPGWKVAVLFVGFIVVVLATVALCLKFFVATLNARYERNQERITDVAPYELPDYQPPQARLPVPAIVTVPRMVVNNKAVPWQGKVVNAPAPIMRSLNDEGEPLTVPLDKLRAFIALPTPARNEGWVGDKKLYGQCADFCALHGLLDRKPNGGYTWRVDYPIESRRAWVAQMDTRFKQPPVTPRFDDLEVEV